METGSKTIPESLTVEILARLPLKTIARFKTVSKTWKSVIDSTYFRSLFISLHKNTTSSWSLIFASYKRRPIREAISFHKCKTWDLPKPLGSYIFFPDLSDNYHVASSNGLIWIELLYSGVNNNKSLVGNPVLKQWVEIPPPPGACRPTGLVTRVDEDGVVSSFKVVRTCDSESYDDMYGWRVYVYSSETGLWTFKRLISSMPFYDSGTYPPMNLNGMLYLCMKGSDRLGPGVLIGYDFYGPDGDDQCRVISLPPKYNLMSCLTSSRGHVIYIEIEEKQILKVWRLNDNNSNGSESSGWWELLRGDIDLAVVGCDVRCIPMGMNPFDSDIIYLWSLKHRCFVSGDLRTNEFILHQESEDWSSSEGYCRINTHDAREYMEDFTYLLSVVLLSQFVLPQWMDPVPRPPN